MEENERKGGKEKKEGGKKMREGDGFMGVEERGYRLTTTTTTEEGRTIY